LERSFYFYVAYPKLEGMSPLQWKALILRELKAFLPLMKALVLSCARGITTRDYNDCKRCDILVANFLGADKISIGTVMEIAWAKAFPNPSCCNYGSSQATLMITL
jgi:hypothetical protein